MSFFVRKTLVVLLAMATSLGGMNLYAASKPAAHAPEIQKISTLGGKFEFSLPKSYVASALPAGDEASGTAGATGTMYLNKDTKTVVIAAENALPDDAKAHVDDVGFLDDAVAGFITQQSAALPDFKKLGEKKLTIKGLGVRQIDSSATLGGGQTLNTTFLAGSGSRMSVVQVISRASDQAGHTNLVNKIISGK